jgi:hypothetical protein
MRETGRERQRHRKREGESVRKREREMYNMDALFFIFNRNDGCVGTF